MWLIDKPNAVRPDPLPIIARDGVSWVGIAFLKGRLTFSGDAGRGTVVECCTALIGVAVACDIKV